MPPNGSLWVSEQDVTDLPHVPVLYHEVITWLDPKPGELVIDATVGAGGHAAGLLERIAPGGRLLGLDRDPAALESAAERLARFGRRVTLVHASFEDVDQVAPGVGFGAVSGILLDLGMSSMQLADPERGFAFTLDGPLDMRFDPTSGGPTAADLVNTLPFDELVYLIWRNGQEPQSRRIARAIIEARPITTTRQLADVVATAVGRRRSRIHPATRTFQALRIAVNDELGALERALPKLLSLLVPGGRIAVISFHSLEDRIVKEFFRRESRDCICPPHQPVCTCGHRATLDVLTRKPIRPSPDEVAVNPRSRSARLRVATRL